MDIYDKMCFTVSSAGGRRGAQMGTMDIRHPDVIEFIRAKRENGRLRQFNLSLLITEEFIQAVKDDLDWHLVFPITQKEIFQDKLELNKDKTIMWADWPNKEGLVEDTEGRVACKIYRTLPARNLWNVIMTSTYDYAEPGFILIDKVNEMNNNWFCEDIRATNPCGEQPLPPYGSCLLGSINLTKFVRNPFQEDAYFDWDMYRKVVAVFTRMLDNVVEINQYRLQKRREITEKRRHGMGFRLRFNHHHVASQIRQPSIHRFHKQSPKNWRLSDGNKRSLAEEKGPAPIMTQEFTVTAKMLRQRPEMKSMAIKWVKKLKESITCKIQPLHATTQRSSP